MSSDCFSWEMRCEPVDAQDDCTVEWEACMPDNDKFVFTDDDEALETSHVDRDDSQDVDPDDADDLQRNSLDDAEEPEDFVLSDDDDFPETELDTFPDDEEVDGVPVQDVSDLKVAGGSNSRVRSLLIILLLVALGGAGAYYFMDLGSTTPSVSNVPAPAQTSKKAVALPPQPAETPASRTTAGAVTKPVSVPVPPPAEPASTAAPVKQVAVAPVTQPVEQAAASVSPAATEMASGTLPDRQKVVSPSPTESSASGATPAVESPQKMAGSHFALDAGSYLFESNRDSLVAKIKKLGYEPMVSPVETTLDMTRLRLGTYSKDDVQEALDFARSIEPGSYSTPAGDRYVIYAGTFLKSKNIDKLSQRFLAAGIKVHPEPVQVVRTLSRILFGSFASKEEASAAAEEVAGAGLQVTVVKSRE